MSGRDMAVALAIGLLISAGIAHSIFALGFGQTTSAKTVTSTTKEVITPTVMSTNSTSSESRITCSITGESGGVVLRVLTDSGSPVAGVVVAGENISQCGNSSIYGITDSVGGVGIPQTIGEDNLTVKDEGRQYNVGTYLPPLEKVLITVWIPSGSWTIEFVSAGTPTPRFVGPSFSSAAALNGLQLNATLENSSVKSGSFLPVEVSVVGPGASGADGASITLVVRNAQRMVVGNSSESAGALYLPTAEAAASLRGFTSFDGWNANSPPPDNIPATPGNYTMTVEAEFGGALLSAQGAFQVTP